MGRRTRIGFVRAAAALALAASLSALGAAAPASARPAGLGAGSGFPSGAALSAEVLGTRVLTLPDGDGLRDRSRIRVRSGSASTVDVLALAGGRIVHLADRVVLRAVTGGFQRTVAFRVARLPAGTWTVRVRRSGSHADRRNAPLPLVVGSGRPVHVRVRPAARTLYPWPDHRLDTAAVAVSGTDETGSSIPLRGTVRVDAGTRHRTETLAASGTASIPVVGLRAGSARLTATVRGPSGTAVRRTALSLAPTRAAAGRLALSANTVQPVVDGLLDATALTTSGIDATGSPARVSGTLTISRGTTVAARWTVADGRRQTFVWDGRSAGAIVPGIWTATLSLRAAEGPALVRTTSITVSKDHLPYRVRNLFPVAAGNQQGLAVRNGFFYVGYATDAATARIDRYDSTGARMDALEGLPLGHIAELSYSTSTDLLWAANGGPDAPTTVWALSPQWDDAVQQDPASAIVDEIDLGQLGPSGMVAVDDAAGRLLVFAGTAAGGFTITPVSLARGQDADGNPGPHLVGDSLPIAVTGVPQGMEVVDGRLWLYTSLGPRNHLARYDLSTTTEYTADPDGSGDLAWTGEGEGLATDLSGFVYVGAHSTNRIGELVPVTDE